MVSTHGIAGLDGVQRNWSVSEGRQHCSTGSKNTKRDAGP